MTAIIVLLALFVLKGSCYPNPQTIRIPELQQTSAEEINNLPHNHYPRSINTPTNPTNNIEDTVKEVEDLIKSNPALPRLTRGEILDLLENITQTDMQKLNLLSEVRDPKAIMVVMPFTPGSNDPNSMEDLYTKPPVTQIIGAEPFKKLEAETTAKPYFQRRRPSTTSTTPEPIVTEETKTPKPEKKINSRRRKPVTTPEPISVATTYRPRNRYSMRRKPTSTPPSQPPRHTNHKYPDDDEISVNKEYFIPSNGMRVVEPPKLIEILPDLHIQEDVQSEVYVKQEAPKEPTKTESNKIKKPIYHKTTTIQPFSHELNVPDYLKPVMAAMNLEKLNRDPEEIEEAPAALAKVPTIEDSERIKNMLASIGIVPITTTQPTTTTLVPDIKDVADTLSPDMKQLLMSFGLIPDPNPGKVEEQNDGAYYPIAAEYKPESYIGFKPLPEDSGTRTEMEDMLASFGLLRNARKEKSIKKTNPKEGEFNFDMIPDSLKGVLKDIGLSERDGKKIRTETLQKTLEKQHIFNPVDTQYASDDEIEKLNKLLDVIKQLEKLNGTATDEDLKKIDVDSLKQLVQSLNQTETEPEELVPLDQQKNSPNPLNYDFGLSKNEVKRQQSTTPISVVIEETKTPSIKDLEDSFGGQTDPVSEAAPVEATTASKQTGFYYLLDWNSFLDIDNQNGTRVNLRFQPKVGDPQKFFSVSVP